MTLLQGGAHFEGFARCMQAMSSKRFDDVVAAELAAELLRFVTSGITGPDKLRTWLDATGRLHADLEAQWKSRMSSGASTWASRVSAGARQQAEKRVASMGVAFASLAHH